MGHIPVEVLQIIQASVDTIPIRDLLAMRLVNTLFANEIMTLLIQSPRLEDDGLGFVHESRLAEGKYYNLENWWTTFPTSYKRQYLHQKVQRHSTSPCAFSTIINELPAIPHAPRTTEEEYILIDKLIDAWLCGMFYPYRNVYDPRLLSQMSWCSWEPVERTMTIALTASAIIRGDCEELQKTIDAHDDPEYGPLVFLWEKSDRFGRTWLVYIAGAKGSTEAIRLLIANDCKSNFVSWASSCNVFDSAAKKGNFGALKGWIEYHNSTNEDLAVRVKDAVIHAVRIQRLDVAELIETECGIHFEKSGVLFEMFMEGVVKLRLSQVQLYLNYGGFDISMEAKRFRYGPLHGAIYANKGVPDLQLVTFLLEHGADRSKRSPTTRLTPLQVDVKRGNVSLAKLLIEHGADVNASRFVQKRKSRISLVHVAV